MKKFLLSSALVFASLIFVQAQINLKPHIGANYTSLSSNPADWQSQESIGTLIGLGVQLGGRVYLEPSVQWTSAKVTLVPDIPNLTGNVELDYKGFRVPIMIGVRLLGEGDGLNVRIFGGPSVLLNTHSEVHSDLPEVSKESLSNAQWGGNIGAGLDFLFLYFEVGYEAGISSTFKEDIENWNDPKRNLFYLTLGANL